MSRLAVRAARLAGGEHPVTVMIDDGRVTAVVDGQPPVDCEVVGDGSQLVAPGLIDIHTHGAVGVQAIDGDVDGLRHLAAFYASHGVTSYLATIGGSDASIVAGIDGVRALLADGAPVDGATCLGVHLEGPFISACCPGAFDPASIVSPDLPTFERYAERAGAAIKLVTLAPEVEGQGDVIAAARRRGVVCSAGHTAATAAQTLDAVERGVTSVTHLFNAMTPLHHRAPGMLGIALTDDRLTVELICDGVHVDRTAVELVHRCKAPRQIALITDSIAAAGLADGQYEFEEQHVIVADRQARLADGTLAGSTLTLDTAVANFADFTGAGVDVALEAASATPAALLGLGHRKGRIAVGFDADLVGFDEQRHVRWTIVAGRLVHQSP